MRTLSHTKIAVVGMGLRLPGASKPSELVQLLRAGRSAVCEFPPDRFTLGDLYDPEPGTPGKIYVRSAGFLRDVKTFDHAFFGISHAEATAMDPQQRLLLELAWEALEDAGFAPDATRGRRVGTWVGLSSNDSLRLTPIVLEKLDHQWATANAFSLASNRLSYFYDWHGPSETIDTACSSS